VQDQIFSQTFATAATVFTNNMSDPRFARLKSDPRFRRPKKKEQKVVVDERFKSVFAEEKKQKCKIKPVARHRFLTAR